MGSVSRLLRDKECYVMLNSSGDYLAGKLSEKDALKVIREDFVNRDKM